jgi:nucleoside-diphosphate-sugar epimerase
MKVAIIGAAGYVGTFMVDLLNINGITPTVITRGNGRLLLADKSVKFIESNTSPNETYDIVINFAYSTGKLYKVLHENEKLVKTIQSLCHPTTKVIHASTLAVFGFDLSYPIEARPVRTRFDYPYVESKVHMENALISALSNNELHIVRLGNVWGPGSKNWTVPMVDALKYGLPLLLRAENGYSNITDVHNVADYFYHLAKKSTSKSTRVTIHHMGDYPELKWSDVILALNKHVDGRLVYKSHYVALKGTLGMDLKNTFQNLHPLNIAKNLYAGKVTGSLLRRVISILPTTIQNQMEKKNTLVAVTTEAPSVLNTVLSCEKQFIPIVDPSWKGKISFDQGLDRINHWMKEKGY